MTGATVIANLWYESPITDYCTKLLNTSCYRAISRDETRYPDPEAFIPERYLDSEGMLNDDDPAEFAFGFGRRACPGKLLPSETEPFTRRMFFPGRHTGDAAVWIAVATLLATLDFNVPKDLNGKDIEFEPQFTGGVTQ